MNSLTSLRTGERAQSSQVNELLPLWTVITWHYYMPGYFIFFKFPTLVISGAPWTANQLRTKSNEELHKLWWALFGSCRLSGDLYVCYETTESFWLCGHFIVWQVCAPEREKHVADTGAGVKEAAITNAKSRADKKGMILELHHHVALIRSQGSE